MKLGRTCCAAAAQLAQTLINSWASESLNCGAGFVRMGAQSHEDSWQRFGCHQLQQGVCY